MDYIIQYIHKKTNKHHSSFQELDSFSVFFKILIMSWLSSLDVKDVG